MCKLKAKEKKKSKIEIAYTAAVEFINTPNLCLSLSFSSFNFNLSFLILSNVISDNMPVPFL